MDSYPRRENRAINFRFFVVLPHEAIPLNPHISKPLLTQVVLSRIIETQLSEIVTILGWQVISFERYPRFDAITSFMNSYLLLFIIPITLGCMLFLAYWSTQIVSGSSIYGGGGWLVTGSSGGKNAALRRTMEIIEEQKYRFAHHDTLMKLQPQQVREVLAPPTRVVLYKHNAKVQDVTSPPKSLATSYTTPHMAAPHLAKPLRHAATFSGGANKQKVRTQLEAQMGGSAQPGSIHSDPSTSKASMDSGTTNSSSTPPLPQNMDEEAEALDMGLTLY